MLNVSPYIITHLSTHTHTRARARARTITGLTLFYLLYKFIHIYFLC